jgi:tRNA (guanine-N7-)-methyltransferase
MSDAGYSYPLRTIRSYVVRAGRMTSGQEDALASLWPSYGLELEAGALNKEQVFGRAAELVFEIGFGMGGSLVAMAKASPQQDFIGVEVHPPGIGTILKAIAEEKLTNLKIYRGDAKEVLQQCVADSLLDKVQIFFPDPWHKKRHHKRRLIQADFVQDLHVKLKPGGILHLATDWEPYAEQIREVLDAADGFQNCFPETIWAREHARPVTKFEQRGQRLGHGVWDLMFERTT